ncbi:MAG: hypothetical protein COZ06_32680 [Armatimonadetes bacterium CG_4_10_14_3_um_filter_66_18]|nr:hypothetical protein [Armatimonadota bacterium]OIO95717.1 MAG: hypothetical protein AUJ96_26040 [Armatimonadetes bacterium CG2_30_66_41]PIU90484.1 MAG: hypothetical protein COS65_24985 [Armatimonadetes bacterium CG06_land_8_20_14_3_00_66_21]PIX42522.1 MAG: hypothetical protein COZ57_21115 [Armatimonadetes bacterium CG_4_8_14_3_um_filter_66_20]PIY37537.1 MAG: hypothetical protein COZ06_32680 [Armatimonadetes bacterium CG_4_10_14_3_um_filter_66_18]PIZ45093.1 MAG: hypothetical protein COY42_12
MKLKLWHWILFAALLIAGALSPFASPFPDGLEHVAEALHFAHRGEGPPLLKSPLPDYALPFIHNERVATSLAGILGVLTMFGLVYGLGRLLASRGEADDR